MAASRRRAGETPTVQSALRIGLVALLALLPVAGCKLVKNEPEGSAGAAEPAPSTLDALVAGMWQEKVLPHLEAEAVDLAVLAPAIAQDLGAAGERHGYRAGGDGTPWSFATRFRGRIVTADTESRAATAGVDIDGDGAAEATIQLGPVIRGTALRDVLPFLSFSDFADQIEFASLSRALNARAYEETLAGLPREGLTGRAVAVLGAFTLRDGDGEILVTPVALDGTGAP